jgi:hypothetical protein
MEDEPQMATLTALKDGRVYYKNEKKKEEKDTGDLEMIHERSSDF